jgi:uncharacterized UBP type Zn finger protein
MVGTYPWADVCGATRYSLEQHAGFRQEVAPLVIRAKRSRQRKVAPAPVAGCEHLMATLGNDPDRLTSGCQECMEAGESSWAHLRKCVTCGHVGCCDSSPHRHATAHFHATDHPVMRSIEPGETWRWCYVDLELSA